MPRSVPATREAAGVVLDVGRRRFQRLARPAPCACSIVRSRRHLHRRAAGEQRARAGAAEAVGAVGVALQRRGCARSARRTRRPRAARSWWRCPAPSPCVADVSSIDAVGRDVAPCTLLLERVAAGPLEEGGDAAAAQLAARLRRRRAAPRSRSSRPAPGPGRGSSRTGRCRRPAPSGCVYGICSGRIMLRRRSSARVELHLARGGVHQPLDDVDRLRPAGAAVGADRRGVGHHRASGAGRSAGCRRCWS